MKSKLDAHEIEIQALIKLGVPKIRIAKKYGVNPSSLHYWLNKRGLREEKEDKSEAGAHAREVALRIVNRLKTEVYHICSQEMEALEHAGVWVGNGHHAGQNMTKDIMQKMKPVVAKVVKEMVLR